MRCELGRNGTYDQLDYDRPGFKYKVHIIITILVFV